MSIKDYLKDWLNLEDYHSANPIELSSAPIRCYRLFLRNSVLLQHNPIEPIYYPAGFSSTPTLGKRYITFSLDDTKISAKPTVFNILKTFYKYLYYDGAHECNILYKLYIGDIGKNEFYYINRGMIFDKDLKPIMLRMKSSAGNTVLVINPNIHNKNGVMEKYALSKKLLEDLQDCFHNYMIMYKDVSFIVKRPRHASWNTPTIVCREILSTYKEDIFNAPEDETAEEMD